MQRLRLRVLFVLEACEHGPGKREDPERADDPGQQAEAIPHPAALADGELCAALAHARSSSFSKPESTRKEKVAMIIEAMTTTMA